MARIAAGNPRIVWVVRVLAVFVLCGGVLWLAFLHPIFIVCRRSEFNLTDGRMRQSNCFLGFRYKTVDEKGTALSHYLGSTRGVKRYEWVLVEQHGFLFPLDLFGLDYCLYPEFARVPRDIESLSSAWEDAQIGSQSRREHAARYLELLRNRKDREASRYVAWTRRALRQLQPESKTTVEGEGAASKRQE